MAVAAALALRPDSPGPVPGLAPAISPDRQRETLVRRLADLLFLPSGQASPYEKGLVDDILSRLYMSLDPAMRMRLARRVAELGEPPRRLARLMAADSADIARLFLERAELFDEAELIMLAATTSLAHRSMIARRASLTSSVTEALACLCEEEVLVILLANPGARFSAAAYAKLATLSRDNAVHQDRLLARADLPAALAHEMFWWSGAPQRRLILQRYTMERRLLVEAIADLTAAPAEGSADIGWALRLSGAVRPRMKADGGDIATLAQWLQAPGQPGPEAEIALALSIEPETVRRILGDAGGEPLTVLFKALGLTTSQFRLLAPYFTGRLEAGADERLSALFGQLSTDWADLLLRIWDQQQAETAA